MTVLLLALAGCDARVPVSMPAGPTATPPPHPSTPETTTSIIAQGFSIYLLDQSISPQQLATRSHLDLEAAPLLSTDDIISYNKLTHEVTLTDTGYEKIHELSVPTDGIAFAVCVDGRPIYAGAFWVALSSASFDGVVIDVFFVTEERPVMQLQLGYPGPSFFQGDDPRSDPRVMQALDQAGKLE